MPEQAPLDPYGKPCILSDFLPKPAIRLYIGLLRRTLLNHNEQWANNMLSAAEKECKRREDDLAKELDTRIKAHRPRRGRIELDVAHERMSELKAHAWRVERHIIQINQRTSSSAAGLQSSMISVCYMPLLTLIT